ncbi:hypothetical protein KPL70_007220 [Citrus sinensis]|nr:hypothetical protein KPL70_007220 [Citrus sinensis]
MDNFEQVEEVDKVGELQDLQGADLQENNEELVVENVVEPTVGMSFDSLDEMFEYYKTYGLQEGFPVMRRSCRKGDERSLRYVTFTCRRNGKSKAKATNAGGFENVSFLERDARNHVDKVRRLRLEEGDAIAIQRYFQKMQTENDGFYFSIDLDEEGRLKNIFWADPRSRAAYKDFGDVVTFDTTYLTNKYDMPFAPFVGVNHHGQSILLGCGLISHEDMETFTWLFDTWLSYTRHRWCLWHILKKVSEKFGRYVEYHAIRVSLLSVVYDLHTPVEFEEAWHDMLDKYDLIVGGQNLKLLKIMNRVEKRLLKSFLKKMKVKFVVCVQCLNIRAFFANTLSQCCHVTVYNYCLKNISYDDGGKMCGDSTVKSKSSYDARSSSIEHHRYKEECTAFYNVAKVASKNEESHKNMMGWIEKAMKDVSLNVLSDGGDTTIYGGSGSCSENIQDPVVTRRKGRSLSQRKQKQFKRPKQKSNNAGSSTTVENLEIHDFSSQVATIIPTQESHMAMLAQQAPLQHAFYPPYYQSWMNYGGVHHGNLQYFPQ